MSSSVAEAVRLLQAGRLAEAEAAARAALGKRRDAGALHVLGCIRAQAGARDEGLALLDAAIALDPRDASFLNNRARVLADCGRLDEAARDLRAALAILPRFDAARAQLVQVLFRLGAAEIARARYAEAEGAFRDALALAPGHAGAHNNLGLTLQRQGRAAEAIEEFRRALAADPSLADAHVNWGNAIENQGDVDAARAHYERAIELAPQSPDAWLNAASAAVELGLLDEARRRYRRALELEPASNVARYGLAILDLREQRFDEGWRGFEHRFDTVPPQSVRHAPALPPFVPRPGARARVAVWQEQGVGDQVLFSTLLPELRNDARAVVEVDARLLAAYRRSVADVEFVARGDDCAAAFASCDAQIGIGSLALLYRRDRASFARQPSRLLQAEGARVEAIRAALGEGRFIAIAWRSVQAGLRAGLASRKSIPLELFARLAARRGARLVDVQYGDAREERAAFDAAHPGMRLALPSFDAFSDLEGVLAAIEACGEVVTSSNVTAHLAGAAGVPCTVVTLGRSPFHYWDAVEGSRSLWYPSVRVARDPAWRTWEDAFDALSAR
jgi:tetratricopeptide (TPR) repeat protein